MSKKDIKVKPQTTTKAVKNAPKSVEHSTKQAVKDIKTVAKDTLVNNRQEPRLKRPNRWKAHIIPPLIRCTKKAKALRKTR